MDEFDESPPVPRPKPSKIPSWIMLGFILGALFVWALPRREPATVTVPPPAPAKSAAAPALPPRLTDVEAVFAKWGTHALWANDVTYVVMWDTESLSYRDAFEVLRNGDNLFFRSVPRPRGMRALEGIPQNSPLQFLNPVIEPRGIFGTPIPPPAVDAPTRGN